MTVEPNPTFDRTFLASLRALGIFGVKFLGIMGSTIVLKMSLI